MLFGGRFTGSEKWIRLKQIANTREAVFHGQTKYHSWLCIHFKLLVEEWESQDTRRHSLCRFSPWKPDRDWKCDWQGNQFILMQTNVKSQERAPCDSVREFLSDTGRTNGPVVTKLFRTSNFIRPTWHEALLFQV